jgi:hypothetical protein
MTANQNTLFQYLSQISASIAGAQDLVSKGQAFIAGLEAPANANNSQAALVKAAADLAAVQAVLSTLAGAASDMVSVG